jgi:hypothetical protein
MNYINNKKIINLYGLFVFIFLIITGKYYDYSLTLIYGGADGYAYMEVGQSFPNWAINKIDYHYAQRFLFPYFIGGLAKATNIEIFNIFRAIVLLAIGSLSYLSIKIAKKFSGNIFTQIIIINLILLNPYLTRFFISIPTIINDLIFINLSCLIIISIINNKERLYIFYSCVSFAARQTGIVFLFSSIICRLLFNRNTKKKNLNIIFLISGYLLIYYLINFYAKNSSASTFNYSSINGMIYYIFNNFNLYQLTKFISLPILSYGLLIFYAVFFLKKKLILKSDNSKLFLILLPILLIIGQPVFAGPEIAGRNIIRLTSLAYILVLCFTFFLFEEKKVNNKIKLFFIFLQFIYSFHPTFSFLKDFI